MPVGALPFFAHDAAGYADEDGEIQPLHGPDQKSGDHGRQSHDCPIKRNVQEGIIEVGYLGRHHVKVQTMVEKGKRVIQMIIAEIPVGILSQQKGQQAEKKRPGEPGEKTGDAMW